MRLGTADFYEVLGTLPEIADSLVVGVDLPDGGYYLPLFVVLAADQVLDDHLRGRINGALRSKLTARHVPDEIVEVPSVPRTLTGKPLEVPVKRLLGGVALERAANLSAVSDPDALVWFAKFAAERLAERSS